ncbi:MAG: hypothetical protein ACHREM_19415 [Polyangiales bacterium]
MQTCARHLRPDAQSDVFVHDSPEPPCASAPVAVDGAGAVELPVGELTVGAVVEGIGAAVLVVAVASTEACVDAALATGAATATASVGANARRSLFKRTPEYR